MQRVGIHIIEEHVDIMGHHMLAHASGMTGVGDADIKSHEGTNSGQYAECFKISFLQGSGVIEKSVFLIGQ